MIFAFNTRSLRKFRKGGSPPVRSGRSEHLAMGVALKGEAFEQIVFERDEVLESSDEAIAPQETLIVPSHRQVAIAGHLAGQQSETIGNLALLPDKIRISLIFAPGVGVILVQRSHMQFEVVGHGAHQLSKLADERSMIS
jgi:hypothetical protein